MDGAEEDRREEDRKRQQQEPGSGGQSSARRLSSRLDLRRGWRRSLVWQHVVRVTERPLQVATSRGQQRTEHQGKAALVLMNGATAFVDDEHFQFHVDNFEPGDWISLWVSDGRKIIINGQLCRIIRDQDINMAIPAPDSVY